MCMHVWGVVLQWPCVEYVSVPVLSMSQGLRSWWSVVLDQLRT